MKRVISAADANRRFSELLRTVRQGQSVVVTSHGKRVAKLVPLGERVRTAVGARSALFARLRRERVVSVGRWTRDELYDGFTWQGVTVTNPFFRDEASAPGGPARPSGRVTPAPWAAGRSTLREQ